MTRPCLADFSALAIHEMRTGARALPRGDRIGALDEDRRDDDDDHDLLEELLGPRPICPYSHRDAHRRR